MRKPPGGPAIRLFQFPAAIADVNAWRKLNYKFVFAAGNNPWGKGYFNTASKKHAETFGFTNWQRCTGHGRRKKGVTNIHNADGIGIRTKLSTTRHTNLIMGATYDHGNRQSHDNAISALQNNPIPVRQDPRPSMKPLPAIDTNAHRRRNTMAPSVPLPLPSPPTEHRRPPLDSSYTSLAERFAPPPPHLHHQEEPLPLTRLTRQRSRSLSQSPSKRLRGRTSGT